MPPTCMRTPLFEQPTSHPRLQPSTSSPLSTITPRKNEAHQPPCRTHRRNRRPSQQTRQTRPLRLSFRVSATPGPIRLRLWTLFFLCQSRAMHVQTLSPTPAAALPGRYNPPLYPAAGLLPTSPNPLLSRQDTTTPNQLGIPL